MLRGVVSHALKEITVLGSKLAQNRRVRPSVRPSVRPCVRPSARVFPGFSYFLLLKKAKKAVSAETFSCFFLLRDSA